MTVFFDLSKNHKHHEWGVFVTSVTDEFGDTLIKSFVLDLLDPTLANFHSSKCTLLCVFDWLVIELSIAKPVVKYWQRHVWTNSTAKLGVLLSSVVTQRITKAFVPNKGKLSTITTFNLLAFNITWKWRQYNVQKCHAYFEGYGNKNGRSWAHEHLKTHLFTPEKLYFTKLKIKKNWGRGQFSGRVGKLNKYIFLSGLILTASLGLFFFSFTSNFPL